MTRNEQNMRQPHNRSLEEVIQHFFGVKRVFRRKDGEFTSIGARAYEKLIELLYNVGNLTSTDMNSIIETLDEITHENY